MDVAILLEIGAGNEIFVLGMQLLQSDWSTTIAALTQVQCGDYFPKEKGGKGSATPN